MNEVHLRLLGEESSFNMSLERRPRKEKGRKMCEGWCVWQEETAGYGEE